MNISPIFEIKNLYHRYPNEENDAVSNLNFTVWPGDRIAVMGTSGSGKTTILNLLGLLEKVQKGSIIYSPTYQEHYQYNCESDSRGLIQTSIAQKIRRQHFGFVFQDSHLWHFLSGLQNTAESLILQGTSPKDAMFQAANTLSPLFLSSSNNSQEKARVTKLLKKKSPQLSGGQRHRMAIGRAIARNPQVCFIDEPTASLDPTTAKQNLALIKNYLDQTCATLFLVSHNYDDAFALGCNRFVLMKGGRIQSVKINNKEYQDVPYMSGLNKEHLVALMDGKPVEIDADIKSNSVSCSSFQRKAIPKHNWKDKFRLMNWSMYRVWKDMISIRSRIFVLVIGVISLFATFAFCMTKGLASGTITQLRSSIIDNPDFRKIYIFSSAKGTMEIEKVKKINSWKEIQGIYQCGTDLNIIFDSNYRNMGANYTLSCMYIEKGDPLEKKYELYYPTPKSKFPCGVVLSESAKQKAEKAGSILEHDNKFFLKMWKYLDSKTHDTLELPILGIAPDKELSGFEVLFPWELGVLLTGRHSEERTWHKTWANKFCMPNGTSLFQPPIKKFTLIAEKVGNKKDFLVEKLEILIAPFPLKMKHFVDNEDNLHALITYNNDKTFNPLIIRTFEKAIKKSFIGIDIKFQHQHQVLEKPDFPNIKVHKPMGVYIYVHNLSDIEKTLEKTENSKLAYKYNYVGALDTLRTISNILNALVFITLILFSLFGVIAISSSALTLVERNRGEIGISRAFGANKFNILFHYIMVGIFTTLIFAFIGALLSSFLEYGVLQPVLEQIASELKLKMKLCFAISQADYLFAIGMPILVTCFSILFPTLWILRNHCAELLRHRVT